ncbi:hypothetical protein [Halovenus halobia]
MSRLSDLVIMPVDEDSEYVKHVYIVLVLWTSFVILAGVMLAIATL